jgi:hypothetical protein
VARSFSKDVEHAVNTVIEAMVRKLFEILEKQKQKESDFLKIHDALINSLERNIIKQYENHQFSIEGQEGSFNLKGLHNRKVTFTNEEKTVNVLLEKVNLVVKLIDFNKDQIPHENHPTETVERYKKEGHPEKAKNVENTLADLNSPFLIHSQIRGQMEVLNYLKSLSHKDIIIAFKEAEKQDKRKNKSMEEVYLNHLQRSVNVRIQNSKERTLETAIYTDEKSQELRSDLRKIETEINKNTGVLYQAKLEQKISPDEYNQLKEHLERQKSQIDERFSKINQNEIVINEQLKTDLNDHFPDLKTDKLSLHESISLATAAYSMTNEKTIENLRNFSLENHLKETIQAIDKATKEVEFEIKEITEITFNR